MRKIVSTIYKVSPLIFRPIYRGFGVKKSLYSSFSFTPRTYFATSPLNYKNQFRSEFQGSGFYVQQLLVGCIALYSYYIQSANQAIIVDPQNDIAKYVQVLEKRGKQLKGVFLTHYPADFIAGHRQLQLKYGCKIYMGPNAIQDGKVILLKDGEKITIGDAILQLIHTPGHTSQSSCLLLYDKNQKPTALFSGDTLFINEVGRPDLAVSPNVSVRDLAQTLFDSIQKIKQINGGVRIYPGHGAGSSCGKSIGKGDFCTLETQKQNNYALKATDKSKFVDLILNEMPKPPQYFGYDANINKFTPFSFQQAYQRAYKELSATQLHDLIIKEQATIIDVRDNMKQLKKGIIKGSICIGFGGPFANWVGTLLSPASKYVIYGEPQQIIDTIRRLLRIGYTNIVGFAKFDMQQWKNKSYQFHTVEIQQPNKIEPGRHILDIRKPVEWSRGILNVDEIIKFQLSDLFNHVEKLDKSKKYSILCGGGYRAKIAYSLLKNHGYDAKYYPDSFQKIVQSTKVGLKK